MTKWKMNSLYFREALTIINSVHQENTSMENMVFITEAHRLWGVRHIAIVHSNTGTTGVLGTETYPKL